MNTAGAPTTSAVVRTKPIMTMPQILLMNLGFFGIQYSFGMQQTAINPIFQFIGANAHDLPLLNMAGPVTGLLIQPSRLSLLSNNAACNAGTGYLNTRDGLATCRRICTRSCASMLRPATLHCSCFALL